MKILFFIICGAVVLFLIFSHSSNQVAGRNSNLWSLDEEDANDIITVDGKNNRLLAASADGRIISYALESGQVQASADYRSGTVNGHPVPGGLWAPNSIVYDDLQNRIFILDVPPKGEGDQQIKIYDGSSFHYQDTLKKPAGAFSPQGMFIDSKRNQLIVAEESSFDRFDLKSLNYLGNVPIHASNSSFDPFNLSAESYFAGFNPLDRDILVGFTLSKHGMLGKVYDHPELLSDYKACVVTFNLDSGVQTGTIGSCATDGWHLNDIVATSIDPKTGLTAISDRTYNAVPRAGAADKTTVFDMSHKPLHEYEDKNGCYINDIAMYDGKIYTVCQHQGIAVSIEVNQVEPSKPTTVRKAGKP